MQNLEQKKNNTFFVVLLLCLIINVWSQNIEKDFLLFLKNEK